MAAVSISRVEKSFGQTSVMKGIDLEVADGEFVVLVGASGCGKSTLLRMIAGLEAISGGEIAIGGQRVNEMEPRERDVAMVFQSYALYPHLDVRGNLGFSLSLRRTAPPAIEAKCRQTAEVLDLSQLLDRFPRQLSGGQRQRVAMGRAIVRQPKVFLFDEPLSNLDAKLRIAMRTEIRSLHQRLGATSIYVTHDQVEAMTMADRMVVMNDGRIEQVGAPLEVYDRPDTLHVARFIGAPSINVIEGRAAGPAGGPVPVARLITNSGIELELPAWRGLRSGRALSAACRPEHLQLHPGGPLRGPVSVVERLGHETYVYVDTPDGRLCALADRNIDLRPGRPVSLAPVQDAMLLFDTETGRRLEAEINR
jgi:multiple sugar transport system ATP-binding protein